MVQPRAKFAGINRMLKFRLRVSSHKSLKDNARGIFTETHTVHLLYLKTNPIKTSKKFSEAGNKLSEYMRGNNILSFSASTVESQTW